MANKQSSAHRDADASRVRSPGRRAFMALAGAPTYDTTLQG